MREKYESLSAGELREVAKARGLKGISALRKDELVQRMLEEDAKEQEKQIVMDSSAVIIICRVRMMCMYPLHRSAALI